MSVLLTALPGPMFLYQGEELGLEDGCVPNERDADPLGCGGGPSRAGCRTLMPWQPGTTLGFTEAAEAWIPFGERAEANTAVSQSNDPDSPLSLSIRLVGTRRRLAPALKGQVEWLETRPLVALRRGDVFAAANLGDATAFLDQEFGNWCILFDTHAAISACSQNGGPIRLRPDQAILAIPPSSSRGVHHA